MFIQYRQIRFSEICRLTVSILGIAIPSLVGNRGILPAIWWGFSLGGISSLTAPDQFEAVYYSEYCLDFSSVTMDDGP
jgi:hypothetical protein